MTKRDQKTVMLLVLGLAGLFFIVFVVKSTLLDPLADYNRKLEDLQAKMDTVDGQIRGVVNGQKLLDRAKTLSLPVNPVVATADYDKYLVNLLQKSGLTEVGVQGPPPADSKRVSNALPPPGAPKKPGHIILPYQVRAKGSMAAVVSALENLKRTPVMHRIKGLTIARQESTKDQGKNQLNLQMTLEAMIVAGAKSGVEPALKPDTKTFLPTASNPRRYADIAKVNIFVGPVPPPKAKAPAKEFTEEDELVPEYVLLVDTEPTSQQAHLRTSIFQMRETRLRSKRGSGYDTFQIMNEDRTKVLVKAHVLRIDQRDVYFQVREDVYGIHLGQSIAVAMRRPLSDAELKALDLKQLIHEYDPKNDPDSKARGKSGKKR